jgi:tetratricopeptide (TPR) repeat protein
VKGAALALLVVIALPAIAAETWLDAYNRGVSQVRASNYAAGAQSLRQAIEEMPQENAAQRVRDQIFTYVPHFWLGIARLNGGDPDGALREWRTSEEQGAIQNTPYYAQLRDLIGRANSEKQRRAEGAATPSKQEANAAIGRALSAQMDAVTAGGDRSDTYHGAQRKLSEAKDTNAKAGVDVRAYKRAAELADEARGLFTSAADDAKKQRASRPVKQNPLPQRKPAPGEVLIPFDDLPQPKQTIQPVPRPPAPVPVPVPVTQTVPPPQPKAEVKKPEPQPEAESEAMVAARIAVQEYRRRLISLNLPVSDAQRLDRELKPDSDGKGIRNVVEQLAAKERQLDTRKPVQVIAPPDPARAQLEAAYRAFAAGDFASSDRALTQLLTANQNPEAYLLRGCARYTQAMLTRNADPLLASATSDIQTALRLNRSLHLDRNAWSPKLVAFFEKVKGQ